MIRSGGRVGVQPQTKYYTYHHIPEMQTRSQSRQFINDNPSNQTAWARKHNLIVDGQEQCTGIRPSHSIIMNLGLGISAVLLYTIVFAGYVYILQTMGTVFAV